MSTPLQSIRDHYTASAKGDLEGMLAPLAPDVSWTEMAGFPYAGTYVGPEAVKAQVFDRINADWDDYRAVPETFLSDGQDVVAFGTYSGTYRATGKAMVARFAHHWVFANGVVVRFEQYADTHLVVSAIS